MSISIRYEAQLFVMSMVTGAGLMAVYDCLRIFRLLCSHGTLAVGVEDILFGLYCGIMTFMLMYEQNDGSLRGYCIGGVILGMALYQRLISQNLLKYLQKPVKWIKMKVRNHQNHSKQVRR